MLGLIQVRNSELHIFLLDLRALLIVEFQKSEMNDLKIFICESFLIESYSI